MEQGRTVEEQARCILMLYQAARAEMDEAARRPRGDIPVGLGGSTLVSVHYKGQVSLFEILSLKN